MSFAMFSIQLEIKNIRGRSLSREHHEEDVPFFIQAHKQHVWDRQCAQNQEEIRTEIP